MNDRTEAVALWQIQVETAIHCLMAARSANPSPRTLSKWASSQLRALRLVIPYCACPVEDGTRYIIVDRNYKPLGVAGTEFVRYEEFPWAHCPPPPAELLDPESGRIYFFGDSSPPWGSLTNLEQLIERLENFLREMTGE